MTELVKDAPLRSRPSMSETHCRVDENPLSRVTAAEVVAAAAAEVEVDVAAADEDEDVPPMVLSEASRTAEFL